MGQKKCRPCDGTGIVTEHVVGKDRIKEQDKKCRNCDGTGRVSSGKKKEIW